MNKQKKRLLPEAFHPGEYIREEMEERGWTVTELARKLGYSFSTVNGIINGECSIASEMAEALGGVFGTGAQVWLNLQATYWLTVFEKRRKRKERKDDNYRH